MNKQFEAMKPISEALAMHQMISILDFSDLPFEYCRYIYLDDDFLRGQYLRDDRPEVAR